MDLGHKKIRQIRLDRKITQTQMARHLEMTQGSYSRRESGQIPFKVLELEKIAIFFEVQTSQLIGDHTTEEGEMSFWEKEYYKLLGKFEFLEKLYERQQGLPPRVRKKARG